MDTFGRGDRVPPTAWQIRHVPCVEDQFDEWLVRRGFGHVRVAMQRGLPRGAVDAPSLGAVELEDEDVVVVPVNSEAFLGRPGGVGVDLDAGAQVPFQFLGEVADGRVQLVDRVQDEGGAVGEVAVQFGRLEPVPHGAAPGGDRYRVGVLGQGLAACREAQAGWFEPVVGEQGVEVVPVEQAGEAVRLPGEVAAGTAVHLGEEVLAQVRDHRGYVGGHR